MSTYNLPGKHQVSDIEAGGGDPRPSLSDVVPIKEAHLPKSALRSARITAPILLALDAANAWTPQTAADCAALSTALCLCVCAAGLFGEDLVRREYRQD
ncbi:hypothetical protein [Streptomyces violascens]|uniref:hypothetical protein n=1 Tax=Streptomyces violascens TaxID=67381 RepID=UPI00368429D0